MSAGSDFVIVGDFFFLQLTGWAAAKDGFQAQHEWHEAWGAKPTWRKRKREAGFFQQLPEEQIGEEDEQCTNLREGSIYSCRKSPFFKKP
ncbi:unnamed protein product [Prunus armeniaca]